MLHGALVSETGSACYSSGSRQSNPKEKAISTVHVSATVGFFRLQHTDKMRTIEDARIPLFRLDGYTSTESGKEEAIKRLFESRLNELHLVEHGAAH
jgi:hypothetical protein